MLYIKPSRFNICYSEILQSELLAFQSKTFIIHQQHDFGFLLKDEIPYMIFKVVKKHFGSEIRKVQVRNSNSICENKMWSQCHILSLVWKEKTGISVWGNKNKLLAYIIN